LLEYSIPDLPVHVLDVAGEMVAIRKALQARIHVMSWDWIRDLQKMVTDLIHGIMH
jgi:hypothetical protein